MEKTTPTTISQSIPSELNRFMSKVYGWMSLGILMSGLIAWQVSQSPDLLATIFQSSAILWTIIGLQFGSVIFLTAAIHRISAGVAGVSFFIFAALMGLTSSVIFAMYTGASILSVFLITGIAFAGLSITGLVTKKDLSPLGAFCTMALFGIVGVIALGWFFPLFSEAANSTVFNVLGVLVFAGLTAYDTQKIKGLYQTGSDGSEYGKKAAIIGALSLYLDFINLFMRLLRLFGRRR